ncbi:MAG TPA: hypothetical protein VK541_08325 [Pedobacter sp.]|uniref:hypothetical protein n=1 Tax=Pedobacter sp. TaxID=1411316 RepID=UPI002D0EC37E|nr:hypothetical protein [Pedobacter sp.]HMI02471.1 hypothetical protein [Pedobacter sp.]
MKSLKYLLFAVLLLTACDKKNDNLVTPLVEDDFPQVLLLSDEGDGELEDEDKFSFKITLADRADPENKELGGKVVPLAADVTVNFEVSSFKGFPALSSYLLDAKAFYEIDDCTTSEDKDIDLHLVFDKSTGKGSVTFPKGVEEIEIEFETDEDLFDDNVFNTAARKLEIRLTSVNPNGQKVAVNDHNTFEYLPLDDEAIYGEYELDVDDQEQFQSYIDLFGLVNDEVKGLKPGDVDEIKIEFQYGEFKAIVVLKETEEVEECGETETVNKEIEIEGEFEDLEDDKLSGDLEFVGEAEQESGLEVEFTYKGSFKLVNGKLELTLQGEFDDEETDEITLILNK